jgi:putative hydrolase of the HAD superfamily
MIGPTESSAAAPIVGVMDDTAGRAAALLLDFGGTLDAPGIPWKERMFELFRAEGGVASPATFAPIFYRADDALVGHVAPTLSFGETVWRLVEAIGSGLTFDDRPALRRIADGFVERAKSHVRDHLPLLADMACRSRLAVVSNFYGNLETVCEELGLGPYVSVAVDSTVAGWIKPDPRLFQHALGRLGVGAADAVFVGDSASRDMAGARGIGMAHIWLVGGLGAPPGPPCCPGDRVIRSLDELRGLFS